MSGLAGSTVLEDGVVMGANSGAGTLTIGAGTVVLARAGVPVPPGMTVGGAPARTGNVEA